MLKDKIYTHIYKCQKCNKTLYYLSNEEYSTVCKTCGQDLIFEMSRPYNPKNGMRMANKSNQTQPTTASVAKIWGLVGVCVLAIFLMIQGFAWLNGGDKDNNNVCSSCHKTFTNRADTKSITWTSMCEPCYENFKFKEEMKEELHKMEERGLLD